MARSNLLEDDLLDVLFNNATPEFGTGTISVSLHSGELPKKDVEVKGATWDSHANRLPELKALETIDLRVASESVKNVKPGDLIEITDGERTRCFIVQSITLSPTSMHADLKCELHSDPLASSAGQVIETYVDEPDPEESALDIDVELGLS